MESGSVVKGLIYGGFASCVAETITMPVDVVKTRLQMDGSGGSAKAYNGSLDCAKKLTASEGMGALFKGLPPALVRQSTYGSLRYGLYGPLKDAMGIEPGKPVPLWKKIVAGGGSGAIASAVANPTDLMKVRLQTDGMTKGPDGELLPKKYTGMVDCFMKIVKADGVAALWTGVGPTVGRATALAAAELATYDEVKTQLLQTGMFTPGLLVTAITSFASGYVSTVASSPFDVVKSRVMGQPLNPDGSGKLYSGMVDCFVKSSQSEGMMSLYNGFWPNFGRVVPRVMIVFLVMEQLKKNFG